ncbi:MULTISPECIES: CCA tRNA nucleotidyltransferase [unclassified Sphingomonas]|uniref:CCA tRNA nucleotidyltransferase n=1 Tax=unclassified Sphingomonas TaxID=196159 RepID=UPI000BCDE97D|nr:MAG: polynucleotide adenylyltransferase [Sphingomonas sp. 12-62-6]OYX39937.1 MAG: polynucleotide adenylyltransferase [Sphingomonas sp. 32-62-10]
MAAVKLPDAPWQHAEGLAELCNALGVTEGESRFVGGAVRDTLLGLPVSDIDIATRYSPENVLERFGEAGIKAIPTGIAHGTITAILPGGPVEVTTLRRDLTTDGRHATIAFTDDWREDAARRDFTINALYADPATGAVFDYFGGIDDLSSNIVRFIGDPLRRIAEDHLRILRFFRFLARFGDEADAAGLAACASRANDLMALSRERIADELLKLLVAKNAPTIVALMLANDILRPVLPEARNVQRLAQVAALEANAGISPDPFRRLAALLPDDAATGEAIGARLKMSTAQRRRLATALDATQVQPPRALAYRLGLAGAIDRLFLHTPPNKAATQFREIADWAVPSLPISGGALVDRGIGRGPDVARTLRAIEDQWVDEDFPGDARLAEITAAAVDQALRSIRN